MIPNHENREFLHRLAKKMIGEMERDNWTFTTDEYDTAVLYFVDEILDSDPDNPPSKAFLAIKFYDCLVRVREDNAKEICNKPDQFLVLHGDIRGYYLQDAPRNDAGFVSMLCKPDHTIVAALSKNGAQGFHEHILNLNIKRGKRHV